MLFDAMPDETLVLREDRGPIARLTLNRPSRGNTPSQAMLATINTRLEAVAADPAIKVVILTAAGSIFCAGHDLRELRQQTFPIVHQAMFSRCSAVMLLIQRLGKPVIASVQGAAVAAGCQLVASCDLAYAAEEARFGVSGIDLGLFCSTPAVALSRAVARKHAMHMLLTGEIIDAKHAARIGLVNEVVSVERLDAVVEETALRIAAKLPAAITLGKTAFYEQAEMNTEDAYSTAGRAIAANLEFPETRAAIDDFLDRKSR